MTTRAEEIAGEGPYKVERKDSQMATLWDIVGPTSTDKWYGSEGEAQRECKHLSAAYMQGQQDRWIPVSQFEAPAPGTIILFGSKATVRMWTWDANNDEPPSSWATHFQLIELPPNPEQR